MKLTTTQIRKLIKEELGKVMKEVDQGYRKDIERIAEVFKVIKKFPDNVKISEADDDTYLDNDQDQGELGFINLQLRVEETEDCPMHTEYYDQTSCSDLAVKVIRELVHGGSTKDFVDSDQMEPKEFDYEEDGVYIDFAVMYENKKGMYMEDVEEAAKIAEAEDRYF